MGCAILCHENPQSKEFDVCAKFVVVNVMDSRDILIMNAVKQVACWCCYAM
jgi:hypothetical protein